MTQTHSERTYKSSNKAEEAKKRRGRLFSRSKPVVRPSEPEDFAWLGASALAGGVDMSKEEYDDLIRNLTRNYTKFFVIEDENPKHKGGRGPIGFVAVITNGQYMEPHVQWFAWASSRNILRGAVAFFQRFRYRHFGTIVVHCLSDSAGFFRHLKKYVPIYYVGKIPDGDPGGRGDDYIFFQRCREP